MEAALSDALAKMKNASEKAGEQLVESTNAFANVCTLAATLEAAASPRPRTQLSDLGAAMSDLSERAESASTAHIMHHHFNALANASSAFVWLADPDPLAAVENASEAAAHHIIALREKGEPHSEFGDAVSDLLAALSAYVEKEHETPLEWQPDDEDDE